jgi:benzoate-CoA ligase
VPEPLNACVELLDRRIAAGDGERVAIRGQGRVLTYADVLDEVRRVAAGLRSLGVQPEQRVLLVLLDSVELVAGFLGALRIGAVPVPVNPLLPPRDVAVIGADARARVALVSAERMVAAAVSELRGACPELQAVITTDEQWAGAFPPMGGRDGCGHGGSADPAEPYPTWDESPGFWLCTSGSTGLPKLAMHRHADLLVPTETYAAEVLGIRPDDVFYSVGPAFHAYGLGNSLAFPFSVGATAVLEPTRPPTPKLVGEICRRERPTLFFCIPTFYAALLASDLPDDTFASVRYAVSAAEPLPAETYQRFLERFGVQILDGIGSTELTHIFISNRGGPGGVRPGSSGRPVDGYRVRLVDDDGDDVADGEPGHLLAAGPSMAGGYWCRSEQNRRTFLGEWMRTGDMYTRSPDGFYTYLGRSDDMLRVAGEWVSPAEVEAVLIEHTAVLEAAVVGRRDGAGVLRPVALVVAAAGGTASAEVLEAHCRARLAGFKRPKSYELVDSLPKTATGKIQRFKLR